MLTSFFFLNKKIKIKIKINILVISHKILEKKLSAAYKRILLPVLLYTKYNKTNTRPFDRLGESQYPSIYNDNN